MILHVVGDNQRFRVIHNTFRRSTETISRYFHQVLYAIGELRGEMIKPASMNTPTKIQNSYRWFPYFRMSTKSCFFYLSDLWYCQKHDCVLIILHDCIGAIDGTHVTVKVPRSMHAAFRGRKHYTSQNVLAAVDFDMRFTYVIVGSEGSAHDASILTDSLSRPDGLQILDGKFYLGDVACRPGILPPFRKTRYHLNEFSVKHRPLNARELFRHSGLRVTIERAFAALKKQLGWGEDEFFEEVVTFDEVETGHGVDAGDNDAWKVKRQEWATAMWEARGNTTI
ncbi:uncharacterized protein [Lolium perenne]|uniref:uncharacterized protein n=1 Tax=Lolium perenne TaxID=4522 RepID=UPI003A99C65A